LIALQIQEYLLETLKMGTNKPDVIIIIIQMIYAGLVIVSKAGTLNKGINTFVFIFYHAPGSFICLEAAQVAGALGYKLDAIWIFKFLFHNVLFIAATEKPT
jgi:hypothetical protein